MSQRNRFSPEQLDAREPAGCPFPARGQARDHTRAQFQRFQVEPGASPSGSAQPAANSAPAEPEPEERAQKLIEETMQAAHAEGLRIGIEEGRQAGRAEFEASIEGVQNAITHLDGVFTQLVDRYRGELVELVMTVSRNIIARELEGPQSCIDAMIDRAIAMLGEESSYIIHVASPLADALQDWIAAQSTRGRKVKVHADPDLAPGDLRVTTASGTLEAILEERLRIAKSLILGESDEGNQNPSAPREGEGNSGDAS